MSDSCNCAPVLLLGFNRPDLMTAQINAVREARPSRLYIAVDGPRASVAGEAEQCRRVCQCKEGIDWPCTVKTLFRERNLGCKLSVSGALDWFFENETAGIILEDDCHPSLQFFHFASEMLERYAEDERIGAINGFNYFNLQADAKPSYHFSAHMDVWGWASWRRVWKEYNVDVTDRIDEYLAAIENSDSTPYMRWVYRKFLHGVQNGLSSWAIPLSLLFLSKRWLSVVPRQRLVANAGIADQRATHTGGYVYWNSEWSRVGEIEFPLVHPSEVVCDKAADRTREKMEGAIVPRGLTWLGAKFPILCPLLTPCGHVSQRIAPWLFGCNKKVQR